MVIKDPQEKAPEIVLNELKDKAIMLHMAGEYLCEGPFLKETGSRVMEIVESLRSNSELFQARYGGKARKSSALQEDLEELSLLATRLESADDRTREVVARGEVGRELVKRTEVLMRGLESAKGRVDGRIASSPGGDVILVFLNIIRGFGEKSVALSRTGLKIGGLSLLIGTAIFLYLFMTMSSEKDLLGKVDQVRAQIAAKRGVLSDLHEELRRIQAKIRNREERNLDREQRIKLMELNMRAFNLEQEAEKIESDVRKLTALSDGRLKDLDRLREKTFLDRLLRK